MGAHTKTVKTWGLFMVEVEKKEIMPNEKIRFVYSGKVRIGEVEKIGEREDGSHVLTVETQDGPRNFDADLMSEVEVLELNF